MPGVVESEVAWTRRNLLERFFHETAPLREPRELLRQLVATWRVTLAVVTIQLGAGAASTAADVGRTAIESFWFAGVIATVPALLVGFWWQDRAPERARRELRPIRVLWVASSVALLGIALVNLVIRAAIVGSRGA